MSKTLQKANPEIEFGNDPMLQELHKNRIKIYSETKNLGIHDLKKYFQKKSNEFRKK